MKKVLLIPLLALLTAPLMMPGGQTSEACVGRILYIGILDTPAEHVFSEMLYVLINERTGTTVTIRHYKNMQELYDAAKKNEIGVIIENTDRALEMMGKSKEASAKKAYDVSREEYRKKYNFVWLEPFGTLTSARGAAYYAPVLTVESLGNFPGLPRVMNKLANVITDDSFAKLVKAEASQGKPRKIARDFLKERKLI